MSSGRSRRVSMSSRATISFPLLRVCSSNLHDEHWCIAASSVLLHNSVREPLLLQDDLHHLRMHRDDTVPAALPAPCT